jgi:HPt (histidine-containing phosphotransfer) domain-containing protein
MPGRSILAIMVIGLMPRAVSRVKMHLTRAFRRLRGELRHAHAPAADEDHMNEQDVPVLDVSVFRELHVTLGSNTDRVRTVYAKFLDTAAKRIDELRHQPIAASLKTLHALKGSAGMVGASRLAALAARIQEATVDPQTLAVAIPDIESELTTFHGVLNAQLESVSNAG